jgi:hypothetical protein
MEQSEPQPSEDTMTNNTKTREAHEAYVANRKEAGRVIDIDTCEIAWCPTFYFDPYGTYPFDDDPTPELEQCRTHLEDCYWVRSEESDGWIEEGDLPPEKQQAMPRQYECRLNLWYAARALHPLYEVVTDAGFLEDEIKWKGDGEEPSRGALIEWLKVNHPAQASEIETRCRDQHHRSRG